MPDVILSTAVDGSGVRAGMDQLRSDVRKSSAEIAGSLAGAFAGTAIVGFITKLFDLGDRLTDLSDRFGVSTTILQQWGNAAETNGSSTEALAAAFNKLEIARSKALGGNDAMVKSFAALNISVEDLKKLSPDEIMRKIAASSLNAADLVKVLGRSSLELRPLLEGLADGSIKLGRAMDESTVKALGDAHDLFKTLGQDITIFGGSTLGGFIKAWQQGWNSLGAIAAAGASIVTGSLDAIQKALNLDFKGARQAIHDAGETAANQIAQGALDNETIANGEGGSGGRFVGRAGGDAGGSDDFGNPTRGGSSGGGGGKSDEESLRERLARLDEEHAERMRTKQEQLNVLIDRRGALINESRGITLRELDGQNQEEQRLQSEVALAENRKLIDEARLAVSREQATTEREAASEREKAAHEEERQSEAAARAAQAEQDRQDAAQRSLDVASETNAELEQELAGRHDLAEQMRVEFDLETQIKDALAAGNTELASQLEKQKQLTQEIAARRAAEKAAAEQQAAAERAAAAQKAANEARDERQQDNVNNLSSFDPQTLLSIALANPLLALRERYGRNFGESGPNGGPSFREQLAIRDYEREQEANRRATQRPETTIRPENATLSEVIAAINAFANNGLSSPRVGDSQRPTELLEKSVELLTSIDEKTDIPLH